MHETRHKKILIVDGNHNQRRGLARILKDARYHTYDASTGAEAAEKTASGEFDVVLLDMVLPDISGSELLSEIKKRSPRTHVIIMTGFATIGSAEDLIKRGASDYISKPWEVNDLLVSLGNILEEKKFDTEQHTDDFDFILGCLSNPIRRKIIAVLCEEKMKNLMGITRRLQIEDHTKVVFHLRVLKESGMVKQDRNKSYRLTRKGEKTLDCLKMLESQIME